VEALARLQAEHSSDRIEVVMIPTDPTVTAQEMETILRQDFPIPGVERFRKCLDPSGRVVLSLDPLGIGGTVIIDRAGRIAFQGRLTHTYEELKQELEKVL